MNAWLDAAIDWLLTAWRQLPPKDELALIVGLCALVVALTALAYTLRSRRRDATTAARNDLHSCLLEISRLRTEREEKERQLGDEFHAA